MERQILQKFMSYEISHKTVFLNITENKVIIIIMTIITIIPKCSLYPYVGLQIEPKISPSPHVTIICFSIKHRTTQRILEFSGFQNSSHHNHLSLLKHIAVTQPQSFWFSRSKCGLIICSSSKFPGNADTSVLGTTL